MDNKGLCSQSGGRLFSNHERGKQHRGDIRGFRLYDLDNWR